MADEITTTAAPQPPVSPQQRMEFKQRQIPPAGTVTPKPISYGGIMDWKPSSAGKWYTKNLATNPALMALIQGAGGAALGRYVGAPLLNMFSKPRSKEQEDKRKRMMTIIGGGLGVAPAAAFGMGRMMRGKGLGEALFAPFHKGAEEKEAGMTDMVPYHSGVNNLIMMDPILSSYEKAVAMESVRRAAEQSTQKGLVSVGDLVRGAIGAGVGYLGANLIGKVLGFTFGMSPDSQKTLGMAGALGGLLGNTGVIRSSWQ